MLWQNFCWRIRFYASQYPSEGCHTLTSIATTKFNWSISYFCDCYSKTVLTRIDWEEFEEYQNSFDFPYLLHRKLKRIWCVWEQSLQISFFSGFRGSNITLCLASFSKVCTKKKISQNMSFLSLYGFAFVHFWLTANFIWH